MNARVSLGIERGSYEYWCAIAEAWRTEAPLRDRQTAAAWKREHFRCGGCGEPALRSEPDEGGEMVPLCAECAIGDAAPSEYGWSDEHIASRPAAAALVESTEAAGAVSMPSGSPERPVWFSFEIDRATWLRGREDWLLSDNGGNRSAEGWYLINRHRQDPLRSFRVDTGKQLGEAYQGGTSLHPISPINEDPDIEDAERETKIIAAFRSFGVALQFTGDPNAFPTAVRE